jgi:uncharacterized membrane protein
MMKLLISTGSWTAFTGRAHPLLVHLPIGILIVALLIMLLSRREKWRHWQAALPAILLAAVISAVFTCITGYLLSLDGGYDEKLLQTHMYLGIGVAVVSILLYILERKPGRHVRASMFVAAGMLLLISAAGHYGGSLTHGDDYLTAAMPEGLKKLTGIKTTATNHTAYTNIGDARLYEDLVQPVLMNRCYGCHNEQKLKGGLRLESVALIRKGGEHGPVLKDSLPEESELFKRLLLPEDDEHRMPPKGKPSLTPAELELLHWWIAQGAPTGKTVKELSKTPRVLAVLDGMQPSGAIDKNIFVPEGTVTKASEKNISPLTAKGMKVLPVGTGSNYLLVDGINAGSFSDRDMQLLLPLKEQLIWADLSGTAVTDSAFAVLGQLHQLTRLDLRNTAIKGTGIQALNKCSRLRYLNLAGTSLKGDALAGIRQNKQLEQLYLYGANIPAVQIQQLQLQLPKLKIDTGGYHLQQLASDTMVYHKTNG